MAITTYAQLQTAIAYRCGNRSDAAFLAAIPEAITLFESEAQRRLKTSDMEVTATLTATAGNPTVALPTNITMLRRLRLYQSGGYTDIGLFPLQGQTQQYARTLPMQAAIQGSNLKLDPPPDSAYTLYLDYWAKFTPLSTTNTSNWLLTSHPDAYLYGGMAHAYYGQGAIDRGDAYINKMVAIIDDINLESFEYESANTKLRTDMALIGRRPWNIRTGA